MSSGRSATFSSWTIKVQEGAVGLPIRAVAAGRLAGHGKQQMLS